jgi:hypothetical protein
VSAPDLIAASDTGSSTTDDLTNDETPTFSGTAEADSTVKIFSDGGEVGSGTATVGGTYSITTSVLGNGARSITATATDAAGNTSVVTSPALTVNIDTVDPPAPSVPDLTDASDSGDFPDDDVTKVNTPTFDGSGEADSIITLFSEDVLGDVLGLGSDTATAGSYSVISLEVISDGLNLITATATDGAGNTSISSAGLPVIIDTEDPVLTVPDPGFEVNANSALGATIDLDALVSASDSTPGDLTVVCTPTTHILPGAIYPLGVTTTVRCTVTDAAGNSSEESFDITVVVQQVNVNINPNSLNLNGKGVVPVTLLSGDGFDVSLVDPLSVRFGVVGTEAPPEHGGHLADDYSQLKLHFRYSELDIDLTQEGDTVIELALTGSLAGSGAPFEGADTVRLVRNFSPRVIEPDPEVIPAGAGDPGPGQGNGGNGNSGQGNGGNGNGNGNGNSGQGNNGSGNTGNGNSGQGNNGDGNGNSGQGNNGGGNGNSGNGQGNDGDPGAQGVGSDDDDDDGEDDDGDRDNGNPGGNGNGNGGDNGNAGGNGGGNGNDNGGGNGNGNGNGNNK